MLLDARDLQAVEQAAQLLARGELVAFPTETVYGLGARADDDAAVARIFAAKGRPTGHPLIVHVAEPADAATFAAHIPPTAQRLIDAFWPGPVTLIVARRAGIAGAAAAQQPTIGLRCPSHPAALALLAACKRLEVSGVAAPSANLFGHVSPTCAAHVVAEFGPELTVLDGGECRVGIESSIVDCSREQPVLLRPGVVTRAQLEYALGCALAEPDAGSARAPGTLEAHYAPRAKLRIMPTATLAAAIEVLGKPPLRLAVYSRTLPAGAAPGAIQRRMPLRAEAAAHELFAALREFDAQGAQLIWVEEPPPGPEWDGIRDRLQRAAASA